MWFQLPYHGMELGKLGLSFRMWTGGRSFACKLQQRLTLQGLARKQSGHDRLGPEPAPRRREPGEAPAQGHGSSAEAWITDRLVAASPES